MLQQKVMVVGLGYVGIQLVNALAKCEEYDVYGFDIHHQKVEEYRIGKDITEEVGDELLFSKIHWHSNMSEIVACDIYIITVPTPTNNGVPDYQYVDAATKQVSEHMKKGSLIIYESTYPPHTTRNRCVPLLEKYSSYKAIEDFNVAYSPERINPGDSAHKLANIVKLVAGLNEESTKRASYMYRSIVDEVVEVESMEIAEAAKILENSQRDVNIALINQFVMLYPEVDAKAVVLAMNTKWNALGFYNGLVGGHCVAEDPYFLIDQQKERGHSFSLLEEARSINETYITYVTDKICSAISTTEKVLFAGLTFKANTPDARNSKSVEIYLELIQRGYNVVATDPYKEQIIFNDQRMKTIEFLSEDAKEDFSTVIYAVGHDAFKEKPFKSNKVIDVNKEFKMLEADAIEYYAF